jgi:translation initiation factor IF-2
LQREVAPHQGSRAKPKGPPEHSRFTRPNDQYQRSIEQASSSRLPPDSGAANQISRETEGPARKTHFAAEPASFDWTKDRNARSGRPHRTAYKERGSLLLQVNQDAAVPRHLKHGASERQIKAKKKRIVEKQVSPDVYIPTTVSVGTLARLLGVRLGKVIVALICYSVHPLLEHLQHRMRQAGMMEESKYDHGTYSSSNKRLLPSLNDTYLSLDLRLCCPVDGRIWPNSDSQ